MNENASALMNRCVLILICVAYSNPVVPVSSGVSYIPHPISFKICFSLIPYRMLPRCAMMRALDSSGSLPYAEVTKSYPNSASGVVYFATPQP